MIDFVMSLPAGTRDTVIFVGALASGGVIAFTVAKISDFLGLENR